jgi:gamma-glutamyl phosphate reductase
LVLEKSACPIGVLLIIFESRPDCLPQISALAIRSGNGLLLKGGKEAENSNAFLHKIIADTLETASNGKVSRDSIGLIQNRSDIPSLLKLDNYIDLVIPRGSGALVKFIKENTKIPVMGHADGICHLYIDKAADVNKATAIAVDAKTDYPSACNAAETLLLHQDTLTNGVADAMLRALRAAGVTLFGGPRAITAGLTDNAAGALNTEYGNLGMTVEVVSGLEEAVAHIHAYGRYVIIPKS